MSSADHHTPWGTPQSPSETPAAGPGPFGAPPHLAQQPGAQDPGQPSMTGTDQPAPPPMMSPYGMPLAPGGPQAPAGFGPDGRGPGDPGRRRKTLLMSTLAVVAVVGIGGAVAVLDGGSSKHSSSSTLAGDAQAGNAGSNAGNGSAVDAAGGGKPNGDSIPGSSPATNGAQGQNVPDASTSGANPGGNPTSGGQPSSTGGSTSAPGSNPVVAKNPTSAPVAHPVTSAPGTTQPKPSTPATTPPPAPKPSTAPPPSGDCTYLDLPASQMPTIQQGSTNTAAVEELQCLMKKSELGIKPLVIDGQWGSDTQSALTAFQSCNNSPTVHSPGGNPPYPHLSVDGVAGPQTWADLYFWDNQEFNGTSYYCNGTR
jgi:hypothetical protein